MKCNRYERFSGKQKPGYWGLRCDWDNVLASSQWFGRCQYGNPAEEE